VASPFATTSYGVEGEFDGCPVNANIIVEVVALPQILFPDAPTICPGDSIELNLAAIDPDATYIWTINGNIVSNEPNPKVSPATTTTYSVIVQKPGCEGELQSVTVVVQNTPPVLTVSPDAIICIGDQITLTASATAPGTFLWSPGAEVTESITVSPTIDSDYEVEFTSACYTLTETITIQVSPGFAIDSITIVPPGEVFEGTSLTLQAFTTPPSLTGPFYEWSLGQEIIGSGLNLNPFVTLAPGVEGEGQVFTYNVTITDAVGCDATFEAEVTVKNSEFEIPNVFTPDGDGFNDRFRVLKNEGVTVLEFKVFNRWGQKVYDNENGDQGWDGTQNGKPAPSDAYAYFILIRNGDGLEEEKKGEVTLIR
jgi:gliding motility-associated-like protein